MIPLGKLIETIKRLSKPTEAGSDYDGFLSWSGEWHSLTHGLYDGFTSRNPTATTLPDNPDVQQEPHYYKGAYMIGTLLQLLVGGGFAYGVSLLL